MADYEIRDPIHRRISFDEEERRVIDHPFFQRLRFIRQLGFMKSSVYPGAVHDRFSHALGAMHVAGRLFDRFFGRQSPLYGRLDAEVRAELRRRVRLAGLLHDIGHGPFSHASEAVFPRLRELPMDRSWWRLDPGDRQATHEDYSVLLIRTLAGEGVLDSALARDVASLIHAEVAPGADLPVHAVLKGMVSGEVDCDRMDYLLRDSYFCGVAYGNFDIDWLISSMSVRERDGRFAFTISQNGVRAFETMLLARYHMIDQVYAHKTTVGFTHYLVEAIRGGEVPLSIPTDPYAYADLRDTSFIEAMFEAAKDPANYWSHHLMRRIPAKRVLRLQHAKAEDRRTLEKLTRRCKKEGIGFFTRSTEKELSHLGEGKGEQEIFVAKKTLSGIELVPIFGHSDLLAKYNEKLAFTDFFVLREDAERFGTLEIS